MRLLRQALAYIAVIMLALGNAASVMAFFGQRAQQHSQAVDQSAFRYVALALLVGCIALAFIPMKDEEARE